MIRETRSKGLSRARGSVAGTGRRSNGGFSLVEVLVAIALFGVSMSAIGALTFAVARRSTDTAAAVDRNIVVEAAVNDLFSIPWTQLAGRAGCTTVAQPFEHQRCVTVTTASGRATVTVTVTPTDTSIPATSVTVERTQPPATNPFRVAL